MRSTLVLSILLLTAIPTIAQEQYDVLITGGRVIDGTGNPWFRADIGIRDGMIVAVGRLDGAVATRTIEASGRTVAPGFIDLHSHGDGALASDDARLRAAPNLVAQGITTVVVNQDGRSPESMVRQRADFRQGGTGLNVVQLVGHGTVRRAAMGDDFQRPATEAELLRMRELVRQAMEEGAWGMSAGLEYVPGRWSTPGEMVALGEEIAAYGGVYIVHERSSGADPMWFLPSQDPAGPGTMLDNIVELITVAETTGVTTVATHVKVKGVNFWGSSGAIIHLIEEARARGVNIYADQYPYNTTGTDGSVVLIPGWATRGAARGRGRGERSGPTPAERLEQVMADPARAEDLARDIQHEINRRGGPDGIVIMDHPDRQLIGKSLREAAEMSGVSPLEMAYRIQLQGYRDRRGGARIRGYSLSEIDVEPLGAMEWTATSTDAGISLPGSGPVHPRFYGSFPRKIRHYAMDRGLMSVAAAIRSSTTLPAQILGFRDRGQVREGFRADLVILDLENIRDQATAFEPHQYSDGVDYVLVGGEPVVEDGELTWALPGEVLTLKDV